MHRVIIGERVSAYTPLCPPHNGSAQGHHAASHVQVMPIWLQRKLSFLPSCVPGNKRCWCIACGAKYFPANGLVARGVSVLCRALTMDRVFGAFWVLLTSSWKGWSAARLAFCRPQRSMWWKEKPVVKFNSVCRFCVGHESKYTKGS